MPHFPWEQVSWPGRELNFHHTTCNRLGDSVLYFGQAGAESTYSLNPHATFQQGDCLLNKYVQDTMRNH